MVNTGILEVFSEFYKKGVINSCTDETCIFSAQEKTILDFV